jgi:hypothetical protein
MLPTQGPFLIASCAFMSKDPKIAAPAVAALLMLSLTLGGCATSPTGSSLMDAHAEGPARPKVEDLSPKDGKPAMTADERSKLQKELIAARDRQESRAKAQEGAASRQLVKPWSSAAGVRQTNSMVAPAASTDEIS